MTQGRDMGRKTNCTFYSPMREDYHFVVVKDNAVLQEHT